MGILESNDSVTREQIVTMLWRMAGRPETGDNVQVRDFADEEVSPLMLLMLLTGQAQTE